VASDPNEIIDRALCCAEGEGAIEEYEERAARDWLAARGEELAAAREQIQTLARALGKYPAMEQTDAYDSDGELIVVWNTPPPSVAEAALAATPVTKEATNE